MDPVALPPLPEQKEKPPHVEFKLVPVEDREATMKAGQMIMKDAEFIMIYPRGGKDCSKQKIPNEKTEIGNPNPAFVQFIARFGHQYQAWKQGQDIPVEGTALKLFPLLTPAQIENCRTYHILTVEQLAEASEEALQNIGMGSRKLKMTAQKWLDFGKDGGKQVTQFEGMEAKNDLLQDQVKQLTAKLKEMEDKTGKPSPKNGRKKKVK